MCIVYPSSCNIWVLIYFSFLEVAPLKMTLGKKLDSVCYFLAPVRFQSHLSSLLKTLISIEKYHFI